MPMTLRTLVNKVDGISQRTILWTDLALGCFIALGHGGALAVTYGKPTPDADAIRQVASISLPLAAVVLLTSVAALVRVDFRRRALAIHGVVFTAAAVVTLLWALSILVRGLPEGTFVWSVGIMTALVGYGLFVASRYSVPKPLREHVAVFYAPVLAVVVSLPIDVAVFVKTFSAVTRGFG
jgi:hypothetical protein